MEINLTLILITAGLVLAIRLAGFYASRFVTLSAFWQRFLRYVPYGAFTALAVPGFTGQDLDAAQLIAGGGAVYSVYQTKKTWVGIVVGLALFGLLRLWL